MLPIRYLVFHHICLLLDILDIYSTWVHRFRYETQIQYLIYQSKLCVHNRALDHNRGTFFFLAFEGIAGLAVTYGLNLNIIQSWMIWELCSLENKIISVERILQFSSIPSEPPLVVEENRPHDSWPSCGRIDIHNLQVIGLLNMLAF